MLSCFKWKQIKREITKPVVIEEINQSISFHFFLYLSTFSSVCDFIWTSQGVYACFIAYLPRKVEILWYLNYTEILCTHMTIQKKVSMLPDIFMSVHVHGVELLHLFLTGLLLHVLKHLISYVFGEDREQQTFLLGGIRNNCL